ncbi:hypothetical protein CFOL_v3_35317, partial [Cephalotus follicularis]
IYGLCDSPARKQLWSDIIFCSNRCKKTPWTLLGDFNVTRFSHEHNNNGRVTKAMEEFNSAIAKKLDRALGNCKWFKIFGDSIVHTYNQGISDHAPLSIQLMQQAQSAGRPFKFVNFWANHPDFLNLVRHVWSQTYEGSPLRIIQLKLKSLKPHLKKLSTRPDLVTTRLRQELEKVQLELDGKPEDVELKKQEIRLRNELAISTKNEEVFFKQKSRIHWLQEGDSNTAFFHIVVKVRQSKNHFVKIQNEQGLWLETKQEIAQDGIDYFKNLLGHQGRQLHQVTDYPKRLSADHENILGSPVTRHEVEKAFYSLNPNKAPAPDGYNGYFCVKAWQVIGDECVEAVFFASYSMPQTLNATILALIPKCSNPSRYADFLPISCCNFLYKVITKILANRIKLWLHHIIYPAQSAFIGGRQIEDNILLAQ